MQFLFLATRAVQRKWGIFGNKLCHFPQKIGALNKGMIGLSVMAQITLKELHTFDDMLARYPLIQQLNPAMTLERYRELLNAILKQGNYFQIAAFENNICLGVSGVWIGTQLWCGKFIEIDNFIVDENSRGKGIGRLLVNWIETRARQERCEMMRLDTYVVLEQAQRFYFSHGFKILGFHMTKMLHC